MNNYFFFITCFFLLLSCSKKTTLTSYEDKLAQLLEESLENDVDHFGSIANLSSYTNEFNERFIRLYNNQNFIIKTNQLLEKKKFSQAKKELDKLIISNGKNAFSNDIQKLFENVEAIQEYSSSFPFEDKVENSRAFARLKLQTKLLKDNPFYSNWLNKERVKLKDRIKYENELIYSNLQLYSDFFQTQKQTPFNTANLLIAYALPKSLEASTMNSKKNNFTKVYPENEWLNDYHYLKKNKSLQQLFRKNYPTSLSGLLIRIEYYLDTNQLEEAFKYIKILLDTKLIDHKSLAKIIHKKYTIDTPDSFFSINSIIEALYTF